MPASVELFVNVQTPAARVFLETSFLRDVFEAASPGASARAMASNAFLTRLQGKNVYLWTTPWVIEEAAWPFLRNPVMAAARASSGPSTGWKDFRRGDPAGFRAAYATAWPRAEALILLVLGLGISVRDPVSLPGAGSTGHTLMCRLAKRIAAQYHIELADAFHIASARLGQTKHIASHDRDFQEVDGICVYAYQ